MILDGVLPPAQTVGSGAVLDVLEYRLEDDEETMVEEVILEEVEDMVVEEALEDVEEPILEIEEMVLEEVEEEMLEVLEVNKEVELKSVKELVREEVLDETDVPVDAGSVNLKTASTPEFATAAFKTFFGQPPLIRFSRDEPTQPALLEQSSASCSTEVIPRKGAVTESPDLKSVLRQTPKRAPLLVVITLDGPRFEAQMLVFCGGGAGVTEFGSRYIESQPVLTVPATFVVRLYHPDTELLIRVAAVHSAS
ncbi:hypothetical protein IFR05_008391 [Cadophora sp. M221]|nr:hypothetical protein IFR05_008391 [Cadophora sp. M221]